MSTAAGDQLLRMLQDELPRLRKSPLELVRLDPYEGCESDAPLSHSELADRILVPLLAPSEERRAHGVVHVVDASRATQANTDAWGRAPSTGRGGQQIQGGPTVNSHGVGIRSRLSRHRATRVRSRRVPIATPSKPS